jgi:ketosteroid isomerase-like protein
MSQENVEIVRGLHEAFARGDNDTPFSVYDPEIEWDMTRLPLPGEESVYHGHDGVRRYWRAWLEAWEFIEQRRQHEANGSRADDVDSAS